jgi:hypothetical protein
VLEDASSAVVEEADPTDWLDDAADESAVATVVEVSAEVSADVVLSSAHPTVPISRASAGR